MKTRIIKLVIFSLLVTLLFSTYAMAFGVTLNSQSVPTSVSKGSTAYYKLALDYDTEVYGIPVPMPCQIGAEIPYMPFKTPIYRAGSFSSMTFAKTTGSKTGVTVYECYKSFNVMGTTTKSYSVSAVAENFVTSGKGYVGVGPGCIGYHYYFTTSTR